MCQHLYLQSRIGIESIALHKRRQWHLIDGQSNVIKAMLFAVTVVNWQSRTLFLSSAWKDSRQGSRVVFRCQNSDPYIKTGITQDTIRLLDESGLS